MKLKRYVSTILIIAILVSQISWLSLIMPKNVVYAEEARGKTETIATKYFYNQLTDDAKVFYDALDELLCKGDYSEVKKKLDEEDSKFGVDSKDITEKINASASLKAKLDAYTKGNQDLLNTMGAARDAYMADHAGLFFVDPDNITLRVTKKASEEKLNVSIGIGRTETYINKAFWDASSKKVKITELKAALDEVEKEEKAIVDEINKIEIKAGQDIIEQKIRKAHDILITKNAYKLEEDIIEDNKKIEDENQKGDPWNVRTVYGAFGPKHQIVCEGYARALKMILDDLNIPCVLVYGAYTSGNVYEEHMWNYVQLEDGKWYGVDVTWDNTDEMIDGGYDGEQERISTEYFLAGDDKMSLNHLVTGIMSVSNFEFKYPELEKTSDKYSLASENSGLRVEIDDESYDEEDDIVATKFKVSYAVDLNQNGVIDPGERMGHNEMAKHGYYLVGKMVSYYIPVQIGQDPNINDKEEGWGNPDYFGYIYGDMYASLKEFKEENGDSYLAFYNSNCQFVQFGVTTVPPLDSSKVQTGADLEKVTTFFGTSADLVAMSDMIYNPNGGYIAAPYVKRATPALNSTMIIGETYHCTFEYDDVLVPVDDHTQPGVEIKIRKSSNPEKNTYKLENFKFDGTSTFEFDFTPSELYADDAIFYDVIFTGVVGARSGKKPMETGFFCAHKCSAYAYKSQGFDWNVYGKPTLMDDVNLDNLTDEENEELSELLKHRMTLVTTTTKPSEKKAMDDLLGEEDVGGTVEKTETYNISLTLCKMQKIQDGQAVRIMLGFPAGYGPEDAGVTFKAYHYTKDEYGNITGVEEIPCMITELGLIIECKSFSPFTIATIKEDGARAMAVEDKTKTIIFQSSKGGTVLVDGQPADKIELNSTDKTTKTITIQPDDGYTVDDLIIGEKVIDLTGEETTYEIKYEDLSEEKYDALVSKVAFIPTTTKEAEKAAGLEVVAQPMVAQPTFEVSTEINKIVSKEDGQEIKESAQTLNKDDIIEITYKLENMTAIEDGLKGLGALLTYNKDNLEYVNDSLKGQNDWKVEFNKEGSQGNYNIVGTYKLENGMESSSSIDKTKQIGEIFTIRFKVKQDINAMETVTLKNIDGGTGEQVPTAQEVASNLEIRKVIIQTEDKLEKKEQASCEIKENTITGIEPGTTVADLEKQISAGNNKAITYFGSKLTKDEEGNVIEQNPGALKSTVNLYGEDILSTGATVKVGNKTWTIVVTGDIDGDGDISVNDIAQFKLQFIGLQPLAGAFLDATEIDGLDKVTPNDLVRLILYFIGEEETLKIK